MVVVVAFCVCKYCVFVVLPNVVIREYQTRLSVIINNSYHSLDSFLVFGTGLNIHHL